MVISAGKMPGWWSSQPDTVSELPAGFRRDIRAWLVVLLGGDARTRSRSPPHSARPLRHPAAFIEHWAVTRGHLREITPGDVDTVLERPREQCSWTAPVTGLAAPPGAQGRIPVPRRQRGDEAAGLRLWDGNRAVRLHAAHQSESAYALLIERRMPGTPLGQPHTAGPFRPLAQMCAAWAEEFEREYAAASAADRIDPGLARAGIALFRALPETAGNRVLPCTDLHGGNILAAQRAPWLVIDPKPYLGDPACNVLQHMLNCEDRLAADPAGPAKRMAGMARARSVTPGDAWIRAIRP